MPRVFSYGSNLCIERLRERIPDAALVATARLDGYRLEFHKRARDGSGKADAYGTGDPQDAVWGAVYEMSRSDKRRLDRMESLGVGYFEREVTPLTRDGATIAATVYVANPEWVDSSLVPYSWYHDFVLIGALQHELDPSYVERIRRVPHITDSDAERDQRHRAIVAGVNILGDSL